MLALALVLVLTNTALSVWQRLADMPLWLQVAYVVVLVGAALAAMLLAWRWLRPRRQPSPAAASREPVSETSLEASLQDSLAAGVNVEAALRELTEQRRRKASGEVHIAIFGEVSTGKSSLVRALVPKADAGTDVRAGSTRTIRHYHWQSDRGDRVVIADLPGFNLADDAGILEEARRAHLVVFLCDNDLTRTQYEEFARLRELRKPLIVAINKTDRYNADELAAIHGRIAERTGLPPDDICAITSGGREQVVRLLADGNEEVGDRDREIDVEGLRRLIQSHLDCNQELMESLRDTAVLLMASEKLESARQVHRQERADALVRTYSRRAIVGALAAVAPGSDLVIQGVLATRLVQELCALYDVSVREVQIESFLKLAGGKLRKMSALTLAIAGNALKAFPGLGTLSGGLLHAVAYGMIFDSLGRAAAATLASRGTFRPLPAAQAFEELMSENLESGAKRFARLAVSETRQDGSA